MLCDLTQSFLDGMFPHPSLQQMAGAPAQAYHALMVVQLVITSQNESWTSSWISITRPYFAVGWQQHDAVAC
jgi:hypothetical protein